MKNKDIKKDFAKVTFCGNVFKPPHINLQAITVYILYTKNTRKNMPNVHM